MSLTYGTAALLKSWGAHCRAKLAEILAVVGALKLPGDAKELWSYVRSHLYPLTWSAVAVVIAFAGWWREAPFWQVALAIFVLAILVYCFVFTLGVLRQRGAFDRRTNRPEPNEGRETEPQVPRTLNYEDLKQRSRELSNKLFEFYRREQEDLDKRLRSTVLAAEYDRSQIRREATARHNRKTMDRYGEQLGSDVLALSQIWRRAIRLPRETRGDSRIPQSQKTYST